MSSCLSKQMITEETDLNCLGTGVTNILRLDAAVWLI